MVAGDIAHSGAAVASSMSSSPCARNAGTRIGNPGASRLPDGASRVAQQIRSAAITASSYFSTSARVLRGGRGSPGEVAARIALRA